MTHSPPGASGSKSRKVKGSPAGQLKSPQKHTHEAHTLYATGGGSSTASTDPTAQSITALPRKWVALRRKAAVRQNELVHLALPRGDYDALVDATTFAWPI